MLSLYPTGEYFGQAMLSPIIPLQECLLRRDMQKSSTRTANPPRNRRPKLHEKMLKAIHDIYSRDETFLDFLAHDLEDDSVWFNNSEFARFHDIDGEKILSILTSDTRTQSLNINIVNEKNSEGISRSRAVLYCRAQEISGVNSDQPLRIDGKLYTVSEARLIQDQVWRIVLEANNG